jgi:DNA-binding response OmpR family regulator
VIRPVLVVDDEPELADAVVAVLERHGFPTRWVTTLADARLYAADSSLMLLDLGLPDGDGLTACAELAARVPVIVISARGDEVDRVIALESGADDYLAKPFSTRELVARCRAVLRRAGAAGRSVVHAGDIDIDIDTYEVRRDGSAIDLTAKEMALLMALASRLGAPVRRAALASEVWNENLGFVQRTLEVHISSLRTKLGSGEAGTGYIDTVHGIGYRLRR